MNCLAWGQAHGKCPINASLLGGGAVAGVILPELSEVQELMARVTSCPGLSRTEVFSRMW